MILARWIGLLALAALLWLAAPMPAAADLSSVGGEAAVGADGTGEACRVRLVQDDAARGLQRFNLYCDGWTVASGTLFRFRVSREFTPERLLTDSTFQRGYETRLGACGVVEPTMLGDGTAAALRQCTRVERGWPVVVAAAVVDGRGIAFEAFPTNVRVLEAAVAVLRGKTPAGGPRDGTLSAAIRRAETIVGASGKLIGIQDIGAAEVLWRLGKLQYRSGNYAAGEATFGRLLEIHERVVGADRPGTAAILSELALTIGHQGRFDDADRVFARAEKAEASFVQEDTLILYAYRASVHREHNPADALRWSEQAVTIAERFPEASRGRPFSLAIHAVTLRTNKRLPESEAETLKAMRMFERPGQDPEWRLWWVGELHELLGRLYRDQGRFADARREFGLGLARREMLVGEAAPRSIEGHVWLALTEQSAGDLDAALKHYRRAADLQVKNRTALEGARLPSVLSYLEALAGAADERPTERAALSAETFTAMQIPRGNETAKALRAMATRVGSGEPKLAALTRDLQDVSRRRTTTRALLAEEMTRPAEQREAREEDLKRQLREAEEKVEALETQLQAEFPRYGRLTAERPLTADEVQALLRPEEALIAILPGTQSTFVAVILRGTVQRLPRPGRAGDARHRGQGAAREPGSHRGPARLRSESRAQPVHRPVRTGRRLAVGYPSSAGGAGRALARVYVRRSGDERRGARSRSRHGGLSREQRGHQRAALGRRAA